MIALAWNGAVDGEPNEVVRVAGDLVDAGDGAVYCRRR